MGRWTLDDFYSFDFEDAYRIHNADCDAYEARIEKLEADKNHLRLERNAERATCRRLLATVARVKAESLARIAEGRNNG